MLSKQTGSTAERLGESRVGSGAVRAAYMVIGTNDVRAGDRNLLTAGMATIDARQAERMP